MTRAERAALKAPRSAMCRGPPNPLTAPCASCGKPLDAAANFCTACGAAAGRPPEPVAVAVKVDDDARVATAPRGTLRARAWRALCCAPPDCRERTRWCCARWCCRLFVWFIVLTAAAGGLAVHILSQDAAEEAASATEAVSTAARAPGASAGNVTCTAAADETPCPTPAPTPCRASLIVVKARNFKNDDGVAKLWVHNDKDEWNADKDDWDDDDGAFFVGDAPIHNKENTNFTVYTTAVPANYGVLVLHDKDANGKMKTNGVGKPREGVGASRGAAGSWTGGPRWSKAKFWVPECSVVTSEVKLWYA